MMKEIYIVKIFSEEYIGYDSEYTLDECFTTYEYAKEYLLQYFDIQYHKESAYFTLKENMQYTANFLAGDIAEIHTINLIK